MSLASGRSGEEERNECVLHIRVSSMNRVDDGEEASSRSVHAVRSTIVVSSSSTLSSSEERLEEEESKSIGGWS